MSRRTLRAPPGRRVKRPKLACQRPSGNFTKCPAVPLSGCPMPGIAHPGPVFRFFVDFVADDDQRALSGRSVALQLPHRTPWLAGRCRWSRGSAEGIKCGRMPSRFFEVHRGFSCSTRWTSPQTTKLSFRASAHPALAFTRNSARESRNLAASTSWPAFSRGTADTAAPWLGDKPGGTDSRFLGRRQDAVQTAGIDAAPPSE